MSVSYGGDSITFADGSVQSGGWTGMKNRIINGAMVIDQRNAGAAVTINTASYTYTMDRWAALGQATDGVYTIQRSTTAPAGFINSLLATVTTADTSIGVSQYYLFKHAFEGFNIADLGWGAAGAATVTLSFWVRSSLTGVFSGSITNGGYTRAYPFSYTINAANTWEQKSITIAGDTTGTWPTDNTNGMNLYLDLGSGSSNKGTANAWVGSGFVGVTGSVNLIGTNGATFYITGVQLERGSTASSFEYRPYGTELQLCQRYYQTYPGVGQGNKVLWSSYGATYNYVIWSFKTTMRISPTVGGATMGTLETPSPDAVTAYAAGSNYAAYGYTGSAHGQATATAEF